MDSNRHLQHLMGEATRLVRNGRLADATRAIQQSLGARAGRFEPRQARQPRRHPQSRCPRRQAPLRHGARATHQPMWKMPW